jgi:hypothetical protein
MKSGNTELEITSPRGHYYMLKGSAHKLEMVIQQLLIQIT